MRSYNGDGRIVHQSQKLSKALNYSGAHATDCFGYFREGEHVIPAVRARGFHTPPHLGLLAVARRCFGLGTWHVNKSTVKVWQEPGCFDLLCTHSVE